MNTKQQKYYDNLVIFALDHGCEVISPCYETNRTPMQFKCQNGHLRTTSAGNFKVKPNSCKTCFDHCSIVMGTQFIIKIEALGGKVIGKYTGTQNKVECICPNNHICFPVPNNIKPGRGMCKICAGNCPVEAEKNFKINIERLGGKVVGKYNKNNNKVECICSNNHVCFPTPKNIQQGRGMCIKCDGKCPIEAEQNFKINIEALGGKVVGKYNGNHNKVECMCSNGHVCFSCPSSIQQGGGMCIKCAGMCPIEAEINFKINIERLGGNVVGKYTVKSNKVECMCSNGHVCFPTPNNIQQGEGMCKTCHLDQIESKGEMITAKALDILEITYIKQYRHPNLPKLRFDFQFEYNEIMYLVEFDGIQHQKHSDYFHKNPGDFDKCRQRDLLKNYLVRNTANCVLIRLDHTWVNIGQPDAEAHEVLAEYFNICISKDTNKIIADYYMYDWIDDEPSKEFITKYLC